MANILIADDDLVLLGSLSEALKESGHNILCARDGAEALEILKFNSQINILITDIIMPEVSGIKLTREALALIPNLSVIVISGGGKGGEIVAQILMDVAVEFGAIISMGKPVKESEILWAIEEVQKRAKNKNSA